MVNRILQEIICSVPAVVELSDDLRLLMLTCPRNRLLFLLVRVAPVCPNAGRLRALGDREAIRSRQAETSMRRDEGPS